MKFHDAIDTYPIVRKLNPRFAAMHWYDFYSLILRKDDERTKRAINSGNKMEEMSAKSTGVTHVLEMTWRESKRPFFNCWPPVFSIFEKLSFPDTLALGDLCPPVPVICARMPFGMKIENSHVRHLHNVFFGLLHEQKGALVFVMSFRYSLDDDPEMRSWGISYDAATTVNEFLEKLTKPDYRSSDGMDEAVTIAFRVAVGCCLLAQDENILEQVILSRDILTVTKDPGKFDRAVARAINRGVIGWHLGKQMHESQQGSSPSPHYRQSHFGIRWTGKGRHLPRVVPIKACFVKPQDMTKIPTGWIDRN